VFTLSSLHSRITKERRSAKMAMSAATGRRRRRLATEVWRVSGDTGTTVYWCKQHTNIR
jgi:hypothetical protein